jgi:SSS family solute:Na+ symporter
MGMTGSGAKYGMLTTHFYWIGAIPAMVFLALFMMRFYYGSKARSVPEFLKLRFDEKTRALNAILFAVMTIMASGISMYALALLMEKVLGWNFNVSLWLSAVIVLAYTYLGGLSSAIYNEVLQFFIILIGLLPIVILALMEVGGWSGLKEGLAPIAAQKGFAPDTLTTTWKYTGAANANPMGVKMVWHFCGSWICSFIWLLVYQFFNCAKGNGRRVYNRRTQNATYRRHSKNVYSFSDHCTGYHCAGIDQQSRFWI